ncbi:MAG: S-methyl-5'-thioinosine phosphorylase [Pseudomonadota bacterium]
MSMLAIIGGTGLTTLDSLSIVERKTVETPYGKPSATLQIGEFAGREIVFLARHGLEHHLPPHKINYRANLWALKDVGVSDIIAVAAVGGIHKDIPPEKIIIPEQIIDYTYGRKHTFFEDESSTVTHIDFTNPYSAMMRQNLFLAAEHAKVKVFNGGVYGVTQGPRLETAAEIVRMQQDGCDIVGMTGMPEAALAKELGLNYACCALCVNWAAGKTDKEIAMDEIGVVIEKGMESVKSILVSFVKT